MQKIIILFSVALGIFLFQRELQEIKERIQELENKKDKVVTSIPAPPEPKKKAVPDQQYHQQFYVPRIGAVPQYYPNGTVVGNYCYLNGRWYLRLN